MPRRLAGPHHRGAWVADRRLTLTATGYLFGVARLLAVAVPAFAGARAWRRRIAPAWSRSRPTLADIVGAISAVIVLSEVLGSVGLFRRGPLVASTLVLGLGSVWWCGPARGSRAARVLDRGDEARRAQSPPC